MRRSRFKYIIFGSLSLFIILCLFIFIVERFYPYIPVLMYHSVFYSQEREDKLTVDVNTFRRQMEFLRNHGYRIIRVEDIPQLLENKKIISGLIAISFDDGFENNYLLAYPILKEYKIPATIFLVVDNIGKPNILNWKQIEEMSNSGLISFGSHTLTHPDLTKIEDKLILKKEIIDSKKILEENLGSAIEAFSYPKGFFNQETKELVKQAGYRIAVAASKSRGNKPWDIFSYKRIRISNRDSNLFIFWFKTTKFYTLLKSKR